jgi:hypothetical protein
VAITLAFGVAISNVTVGDVNVVRLPVVIFVIFTAVWNDVGTDVDVAFEPGESVSHIPVHKRVFGRTVLLEPPKVRLKLPVTLPVKRGTVPDRLGGSFIVISGK